MIIDNQNQLWFITGQTGGLTKKKDEIGRRRVVCMLSACISLLIPSNAPYYTHLLVVLLGLKCGDDNYFQIIMEGQIAKIIIPMLKNQAVNPLPHHFILTKTKPNNLDTLLTLNFQPQLRQDHLFESILPHFNIDRHHFTPAFVIQRDEKFYRENLNFERMRFQERIQNAQEKQILQGNYKFVPPSHYCQLCKLNFEEYLHHTLSQQHRHHLAEAPANRYIEELANHFLPFLKKSKKVVKMARNGRGRQATKKNSCKLSDSNISDIAVGKNVSASDSKNSNQSTHLGCDMA